MSVLVSPCSHQIEVPCATVTIRNSKAVILLFINWNLTEQHITLTYLNHYYKPLKRSDYNLTGGKTCFTRSQDKILNICTGKLFQHK